MTAAWEPYEGALALILAGRYTSNLTYGMVGQVTHRDASDPDVWWVKIKCGRGDWEGRQAPVHVSQMASLTEAEAAVRHERVRLTDGEARR